MIGALQDLLPEDSKCLQGGSQAVQQTAGMQPRDLAALAAHAGTCALTEARPEFCHATKPDRP